MFNIFALGRHACKRTVFFDIPTSATVTRSLTARDSSTSRCFVSYLLWIFVRIINKRTRISQTDRTTRCVSWNLVNCCTTAQRRATLIIFEKPQFSLSTSRSLVWTRKFRNIILRGENSSDISNGIAIKTTITIVNLCLEIKARNFKPRARSLETTCDC